MLTLTSHLSKIFEKVVRNHLITYLEHHCLLNPNQHGFRRGRSCISQLIAHFEKIIDLLSQGYSVDVVYLDFCKAFDKLDFNTLLQKLKLNGIYGKLGRWLHSFLTGRGRYQSVSVNGFLSFVCAVLSGVPQGSVLGPLLFLVLINDIDVDITCSFLSSFADDTRIGMGIRSLDDAHQLQTDLNKVYSWATNNNMRLNSSKFEMLSYGKPLHAMDYTYMSADGE